MSSFDTLTIHRRLPTAAAEMQGSGVMVVCVGAELVGAELLFCAVLVCTIVEMQSHGLNGEEGVCSLHTTSNEERPRKKKNKEYSN